MYYKLTITISYQIVKQGIERFTELERSSTRLHDSVTISAAGILFKDYKGFSSLREYTVI